MEMDRIGRKRKSNLALRWMPVRMLFYFSPPKEGEGGNYFAKLESITVTRPSYVRITGNELKIVQSIGFHEFTELELRNIKESIKGEACKLIGIKEENYKFNIKLIIGNNE